MSATTSNQIRSEADGKHVPYKVAASTYIYLKTLAYVNSGGYLDDDTASGVNKFAGVATEEKDNSGGNNGDLTCDVQRTGEFPFGGTGFAQTSVGKKAYGIDNNTVSLDPTAANSVYVGVITRYISSTLVWVTLDPKASETGNFDTVVVDDADGLTVAGVIVPQDQIISVSIPLHATKTVFNVFTARTALQVLSIDYVPDIAQGGALTATVVKATGTATPASGTTPMCAAGAINLNGTAHTVQSIALTATTADLQLAAGERIGFVESAAMTTGSGVLTIRAKRI